MVEYPSQNVYLLGKTSDSGAPVETCLFDFLLLLLFSGTKTLTVSFPVRQMQKKIIGICVESKQQCFCDHCMTLL